MKQSNTLELTLNVRSTTVIFERTFHLLQSCAPFDSRTQHNKTQHDTTGMQNTTAGKQIYLEFRMNLSPESIHVKHLTHHWQYWRRASVLHWTLAHNAKPTAGRDERVGSSSVGAGLPMSRGDGDRKCCKLKLHPFKVSAMSRHVPLNASLFTRSSTPLAKVHKLRSRAPSRHDWVKTLASPSEAVDPCSPTHGLQESVLHPQEPRSDVSPFVQAILHAAGLRKNQHPGKSSIRDLFTIETPQTFSNRLRPRAVLGFCHTLQLSTPTLPKRSPHQDTPPSCKSGSAPSLAVRGDAELEHITVPSSCWFGTTQHAAVRCSSVR